MARTGLLQDVRFQRHQTGAGHPERPERLAAIGRALEAGGLAEACVPIEAKPVDMQLVRRLHADSYLERFRKACENGLTYIDVPDSGICSESFEIAQLAAGGCIQAVDDVMAGRIENAFCAVRPPGHHAEPEKSMGFCMFNNIALAARHLIDHYGLSRVLILDFDVHHGNGTQHMFESDPARAVHQYSRPSEYRLPGHGLSERARRGHRRRPHDQHHHGAPQQRRRLPPRVRRFRPPEIERYAPQFVLVDAGFDAHRLDPLAPIDLDTESFGWMTDALVQVAKTHCDGKLVSMLEGGYHLQALADSCSLHVQRLVDA